VCYCNTIQVRQVDFETQTGNVTTNGLQGSQAHRRVEIFGPKARNFGDFGRVFDQVIEILNPKQGVFRPDLPLKGTCPATEAPWWAAGRNWPRAFHQLVEICRGSLRALTGYIMYLCVSTVIMQTRGLTTWW
jgi:hypothetical protein